MIKEDTLLIDCSVIQKKIRTNQCSSHINCIGCANIEYTKEKCKCCGSEFLVQTGTCKTCIECGNSDGGYS